MGSNYRWIMHFHEKVGLKHGLTEDGSLVGSRDKKGHAPPMMVHWLVHGTRRAISVITKILPSKYKFFSFRCY